MRVLIACEFSGIVRDAFLKRGHDAWSCDLLPTERPHYNHFVGDCLEILHNRWDLLIAHPPCTYLTNAGVRWLYKDGRGKVRDLERWANMREGVKFFNELWECNIPHIAVENPIMHGFAAALVGEPPSQIIQPWMFGHDESKATCLWLKGLPYLKSTKIIQPNYLKYPRHPQIGKDGKIKQLRGSGYGKLLHPGGYHQRSAMESPGPDRWKNRSRTLQGVADAMADQWGTLSI